MKSPENMKKTHDPFPWESFSWAAQKFGAYLTKAQLSQILGLNKADTARLLQISEVQPVPMPSGNSFKYRFIDLKKIMDSYESKQLEKLSIFLD